MLLANSSNVSAEHDLQSSWPNTNYRFPSVFSSVMGLVHSGNAVFRDPIDPNSTKCPKIDLYPTIDEFNDGFGNYAVGFYIYAGIVVGILALQYGMLAGHFINNVPACRQLSTFWVNSIYLAVAVFATITLVLPESTIFVWLVYQIYVGMAMCHFVKLTMSWYGGETAMLQKIGAGKEVSFRIPPCCCCLCCPRKAPFSKNKIRFLKMAVYQTPHVQGVSMFFMAVLNISGYLAMGNMHPTDPYLYLILINTFSFLFGLWGLFMFMRLTKIYQLLLHYNYRKKAALVKLMVIFCNLQGLIIDILVNYEVIKCQAPFISSSAMGSVIRAILSLTEALILGSLCHLLYVTDTRHL